MILSLKVKAPFPLVFTLVLVLRHLRPSFSFRSNLAFGRVPLSDRSEKIFMLFYYYSIRSLHSSFGRRIDPAIHSIDMFPVGKDSEPFHWYDAQKDGKVSTFQLHFPVPGEIDIANVVICSCKKWNSRFLAKKASRDYLNFIKRAPEDAAFGRL